MHKALGADSTTAPFLVISRIGPRSLHSNWLPAGGSRGFDVILSCYDRDTQPIAGRGILFEYRAGSKVVGYGEILRDYAALIRRYRYVALFDDDLAIDASGLLRLFQIIDEQQLKIAQPALTHESYFTYACLLQHKGFTLRHVNFVEMMCPFFRSDILLGIASLFELGFESGIDLAWSALVQESAEDFAVIDSIPVRHTRPVGATKSSNGFVEGRTYETDIHAILKHFKLPWRPALPNGGLRPDGRYTKSRLALIIAAGRLTAAVPIRSPRFRSRAIAIYWRQLLRAGAHKVQARPALDGPR